MASFKVVAALAAFALLFAVAVAQEATNNAAAEGTEAEAPVDPLAALQKNVADLEARKAALSQEAAATPDDAKRATKLARLDEKIERAKYKLDAAKYYQGLQDALAARSDLADPPKPPAGTPKPVVTAEERATQKIESLKRRIAREKFVLEYMTANPEPVEPPKPVKAPKAGEAATEEPAQQQQEAQAEAETAADPAEPAVPRSEKKLTKLKAKLAAATTGGADASDAATGAPTSTKKKYVDLATLERRLKFEEAWLAHLGPAGKALLDAGENPAATAIERAQARIARLEHKLLRKEFEAAWIKENGPIDTPPAPPATPADASADAGAGAAGEAVPPPPAPPAPPVHEPPVAAGGAGAPHS